LGAGSGKPLSEKPLDAAIDPPVPAAELQNL
jgi:hypothetical protein